jgi:hypothetical protein
VEEFKEYIETLEKKTQIELGKYLLKEKEKLDYIPNN